MTLINVQVAQFVLIL